MLTDIKSQRWADGDREDYRSVVPHPRCQDQSIQPVLWLQNDVIHILGLFQKFHSQLFGWTVEFSLPGCWAPSTVHGPHLRYPHQILWGIAAKNKKIGGFCQNSRVKKISKNVLHNLIYWQPQVEVFWASEGPFRLDKKYISLQTFGACFGWILPEADCQVR